ncbi:MAG: OmpP1/FadL family transporter [Paludibacter sp.]
MKRIIFLSLAILMAYTASAQTVFEAVKTSQTDILGTARYMSVAGAFGALGGDVSSIKDNPAGLGIFRKSELTATVDAQMQSTSALWGSKSATDSKYSVGMNNFTLVLAGKTWRAESGYAGLVNSNFSFSYNKLRNFNRNMVVKNNSIAQSMTDYFGYFTGNVSENSLDWDKYPQYSYDTPYQNPDLSWMSVMANYGGLIKPIYSGAVLQEWSSFLDVAEKVTPSYMLQETGGIHEYSFGWSGNFSNRLFLGATFNLQYLDYQMQSTYDERFSANGGMTLKNTLTTSGAGANVNIGLIAVPVDFIRLGASLHTPMFYTLQQLNYSTLDFVSGYSGGTKTPTDNYVDYQLQTPLQFNISTAFIVDKKGFISAEYVYNNYKGMKLLNADGDSHAYSYENDDINGMLENARTIKIGGEYRVTDSFSLRAGFANTSNLTNANIAKIMDVKTVRTDPEYFASNSIIYATFGLGYREKSWYVDLAFVNKTISEDYYAYNSNSLNDNYKVTPASVKTLNNNVVVTFGVKF